MKNPMSVIPAMKHTASLETVRYMHGTLELIILCVRSNRFTFLFVPSAFGQIDPPYLSMDCTTPIRSLHLLAITAELFAIFLECTGIAVDPFFTGILNLVNEVELVIDHTSRYLRYLLDSMM